jgi:hypothetical protein
LNIIGGLKKNWGVISHKITLKLTMSAIISPKKIRSCSSAVKSQKIDTIHTQLKISTREGGKIVLDFRFLG